MKKFLYILLLYFGFSATAQTIDDWNFQPPTTDNNMCVVYPSGILSDYVGGVLQAFAAGTPVSTSLEIATDGSSGVCPMGTDNLCACDLASQWDELSFAILMNGETIVMVDIVPPIHYSANDFDFIDDNYSLTFTIDGASVVFGCADPSYMEFDASANLDDGSCSTTIVEGCLDWDAYNYDPNVNTEDGSCLYFGCMESGADNYDANANIAGSCTYLGCTYDWACNYDSGANTDDASCEGLSGCTDPIYNEYGENATCDDGSCATLSELLVESFNYNDYTCGEPITSADDNTLIYGLQEDDVIELSWNVNLYDCYYDEFAYGDYYDDYYSYMYNNIAYAGIYIDNNLEYVIESSSPAIDEIFLQGGNSYTIIFTIDFPSDYLMDNYFIDFYSCQPFSIYIKKYDGTCYLNGCIDSTALNYFPQANIDDGTCDYNGCTDSSAFNYNSDASIDDESCEFPTSLGNLECGLETLVSGTTASNYGFENSVYYTFNLDNNAEMIINLDGASSMYDPYILIFDSTQTYLQTIAYSQSYYIEDSVDFNAGEYFIVVTEDNPYFSSGTLSDYYTLMQNNYQNAGSFTLSLFANDGICDFQGCTYDWAENYNEIAVIDNGSCYLNGCTSENANNYNPFATQDDVSCSYTNAVDFGLLECGETYFHENGYPTTFNFEYEFQLDTRSIVNIGYYEQGAYCLDYNYVGDCISSSLGNNEFSISTFNSIINDWVILENIINNSFDLDSGLYKLSLYSNSNFVESYEIDITAENYCSLEIIEIGSLACGVDTFISGATTSTYGFENSAFYSFNVDNDSQMRINLDGSSGMYDPYILLFDSTQTHIQTIAYSQYYYINDYYLNLDAGEYFMVVTEDDPEFSNGTILEYAFSMYNNFQSTGAFTLNLFSYNGSCIEIIEGCVNNNYFEYNTLANMDTDPSSCSTLIVEGCMDSSAFNFSLLHNIDDGSCDYPTNLGILDCGVDTIIYGAINSTLGFENSSYYSFEINNDSELNINLGGNSGMYDPYILIFDSTETYIQTISYTQNYFIHDYSLNLEDGVHYMIVTRSNPYFSTGTLQDYYTAMQNNSQGIGSFTLNLLPYNGICDYPDCTDSTAYNFNVHANTDDGMCEYSSLIECGDVLYGSTSGQTSNYGSESPEDIYHFDLSYFSEIEFSTCNSDYDTWIRIYQDNLSNEVYSCDDCGPCSPQTVANITLEPGNYFLLIEGWSLSSGDYEVAMSCSYINYPGCTDFSALNYNPEATIDDGSCDRLGCMSDWADNYDALATTDDGSCELVACMSDWADNYNVNATTDNGSCFNYGCVNPTAYNYDTLATIDISPTSCIIYGCTYNSFPNFNELANTDDGSCSPFSEDVFGCIDETAFNFDSLANTDNGGCIEVILGCIEEWAFNFDSLANTSHGSCETPTNIGILDCGVTLSTGLDTISGSNSYETYDNPRVYEAYSFSIDTNSTIEISFDMNVLECDNDTICYSIASVLLFENDLLTNFWNAIDEPPYDITYNNIPSEINLAAGSYTLIYGNENYNYWPSLGMGINEVISQIFTNSNNDNEDYTVQMELLVYDGTCGYHGCVDSTAFNFNPIATVDDGSCEAPTNIGTLECGALIEQEGATTSTYGFENSEYYTFNLDNDAEIMINLDGYSSMYDPYILLFDSTKNYIQTISYTESYYINDYSINLEAGQHYLVVTEDNPNFLSGTLSNYYTSMQNNYQSGGSFTLSLFSYDGTCGYHGCVDSTAFNFNPIATVDDGSCEAPTNIGTLECGALIEQEGATTSTSGFYNSAYYTFNLDNDAEIMINLDGYSSMYNPYILLFDSTKNYIQTISYTQNYYINDYSINLEAGQHYLVVTKDNPNFLSGTLSNYYTSMQNNYQNGGSFTLSLFSYDGTCDYSGCTDSAAFNFNPIATVDDGSCEYLLDIGNIECNTVSLQDSLTNYSALKYYQFEVSEHSTFAFEVSGGVNIFLFDSTFNYMFKMDLGYNPIDLDIGEYHIIMSKENFLSSYSYLENIENLPAYSFVYSYELNIENLVNNCSTGCNDNTAINFNQNAINFNNDLCHYPDTLGEINCDNNIISGSIQDNFGAFNSSYYYFELNENSLYNFSIYSNSISSGISEPHFLLFNDDLEYILTVSPSSPYSIDEHSILLDIGGYYSVITNGYPGSNFTSLFEYFADMKSNYQSSGTFTFEYSFINNSCTEDGSLEFGDSDFIPECGVVYNDLVSIINGIQTYDIYEFNITNDSTLVDFEFENENYWQELPNDFLNNSLLLFKNNELIYNFIPTTYNDYDGYGYDDFEIINNPISKSIILNQGEYKIFIGGTYSSYSASNFETIESASNSYLDYYESCHWTYQDWSYCGFCGTGCYPPIMCMNFNNSHINMSLTINDDSCDYYGCMDQLAYNYSSWANIDNEECQYLGCTDPNYIEYNPSADINDGSCQTITVWGCTDEAAFNYSSSANTDDGSCIIDIWGCTEVNALNYNSLATINDGNCVTLEYCNQIEIFDDFDSYNINNYLQIESDSLWTTWNNYSNNIEDIFVSNINSYSNDNSLNLISGGFTDVVLPLGGHNIGQWELSFMMKIEEEYGAYFNLLHDFNASASNWAVEFHFNSNGTGYIEPAGVNDSLITSFQYPINSWFEIKIRIDINNDISTLYYDNLIISSWQWSSGSINESNNIAALNFYPNENDAQPDNYFIDDVHFTNYTCNEIGCTDSTAFNYSSVANIDDGSCIPYIYGCMDPAACNYDDTATTYESSLGVCTYPTADILDCDGNCLNDTDDDLVCDEDEADATCGDVDACNYTLADDDITTDTDNSLCDYAVQYYNCAGDCINDSDNNGICDELELDLGDYGDIGEECNSEIEEINLDTMSIQYSQWGYGSSYPGPSFESIGFNVVTDSLILNLNIGNIVFYGDCISDEAYADIIFSISIFKDGNLVETWADNNVGGNEGCMGTYTLYSYINFPEQILVTEGNYELVFEVTYSFFETSELSFSLLINEECVSYGCNDSLAYNYNPDANTDNGSCIAAVFGCMDDNALSYDADANTSCSSCCEYSGCTDSTAFNYNPEANIDDGSCEYICSVPDTWEHELTGVNQTIMIPADISINVNGDPLTYGSTIGVFYTNEFGDLQCAGYTSVIGEITFIAVMGDDSTTEEIDGLQAGEELVWMAWDINTCAQYVLSATYSSGSTTFIPNGLTFLESLNHYTCQSIAFPGGWFMYSSYIQAEDMDAEVVLSSLEENLVILKDNDGNAYLTEWDFNGVGELDFRQGYQIKTNTPDTLEICGLQMYPEDYPIALESGWNIISYLRESSSPADIVLEDLNSNDNLIMVKDYDGNPYLPEWDFNGIGNMSPGQGYQLKIYDADTLIYLSNNQEYRISTTQVVENKVAHFAKVTPTGNNMQIVIPESAWHLKPKIGSEIAAYTSDGILVGSTKYSNPTTVLTLWGDDLTTKTIDGLLIDESVVFKVWNKEQISDYKIENWSVGTNAYQVDAIHVAAAIEIEGFNQTTNLFNAIPNPSQTKTNILFFVAEAGNVNISVYNVVGELVEVLANSVYKAGMHELEMQVSHIEAGSYFYTMRAEDFEKTKQLIILK